MRRVLTLGIFATIVFLLLKPCVARLILWQGVESGNTGAVAVALRLGVDLNAHYYDSSSDWDAGNLILDGLHIAHPNQNCMPTILELACEKGNTHVIEALLNGGADPKLRDIVGQPTMNYVTNRPDLVRLLISHGALIDEVETGQNCTPLMVVCRTGDLATAIEMVHCGANVNAADALGCTPLHYASLGKQHETVSMLLQAGANASQVTHSGRTPLMLAGGAGDRATVELLLSHGASYKGVDHDGHGILWYVKGRKQCEQQIVQYMKLSHK